MENSRLLNDEQIAGIMGGEAMELKAVIDNAVANQATNPMQQQANGRLVHTTLMELGWDRNRTKLLSCLLSSAGLTKQQVEMLRASIFYTNEVKCKHRQERNHMSLCESEVAVEVERAMRNAGLSMHNELDALKSAVDEITNSSNLSADDYVDYSQMSVQIAREGWSGRVHKPLHLNITGNDAMLLSQAIERDRQQGNTGRIVTQEYSNPANSVKITTEADSSPNTENTLSEDNDK